MRMSAVNWILRYGQKGLASFCGNTGAGEDENLGEVDLLANYRLIAVIIQRLSNSRKMFRETESEAQLASVAD